MGIVHFGMVELPDSMPYRCTSMSQMFCHRASACSIWLLWRSTFATMFAFFCCSFVLPAPTANHLKGAVRWAG